MTGGVAFVLDDEAWLDGASGSPPPRVPFASLVNKESVALVKLGPTFGAAKAFLEETLRQHVVETGSRRAQRCLENLAVTMSKMTMVVPSSEKGNVLVQEDANASSTASVGVKVAK